ncbi:pentapeptide repeat-containing protein [Pseudomonas aeruginosa]|uniref:pentapeptide repeat-containing protein n=1 Tax=Pseudomonas aeruginosa TaxID=287 RepID=UPI00044620FB|nr:pentapeptide repeat-containing protein [Pseudomonas aeruginosa]ELK3486124.1 pentapeptide repeat-containing protein [Pseudomonas aeruginosa]ELK3488798.1 pentapeptide repeat-containing protein [Pseudomonas aeruginosa]EME9750179.1 pentapeptide repeat-containing protein [Pseudomonas aeruginosa]ETU74236.1 hypothetical protein Q095_04688 [Pseudomonas aeruginosa PS50]MBG4583271.1 pentapeptide repeat-containing protein [Pseudomonas aeruginosa]
MDIQQKLPDPSILELCERWKTNAGEKVLVELLRALRAGNQQWPDLLMDLPKVSNPLAADDLDDLRGIHLPKENLDKVSLACCDLSYSNLQRCSLRKTSFQRSRLNWVSLDVSDLTEANLFSVEAQFAGFFACKLTGAMMMSGDFRYSNFAKAKFKASVLNGSDFTDSTLSNAIFDNAEHRNVIFPNGFNIEQHLSRDNPFSGREF